MAKHIAERGLEREQAGQSLAELSIVLVLFLVVTFGIVDAGRLILAYNAVSLSAREGVRYAIVRGSKSLTPATQSDINAYVQSKTVGLPPVDVTVTWCTPALTCSSSPTDYSDPGSSVEVTVHSIFTPVTPFLSRTINLTSTSKMLISR